jgi:hypothetical protein
VDATTLLSGKKATDQTEWVCPLSVCSTVPVAVSQSRTVWSVDADANTLPSGEKATDQTESVCPLTTLPSGGKGTDQTESVCPLSVCRAALVLEALNIGSILSKRVLAVLSCDFNATSSPSSELPVLCSIGYSVAKDSLVDDRFTKMSDLSVGSIASSTVDSCLAVDLESELYSSLRVTIK